MEFLILPDCPAAEPIARVAARPGVNAVPHASGRPWLIGQWADDEYTLVESGQRRLALIGRTRADTAVVTRRLAAARSPYDLDAVARSLPGSFHLAASFDGQTRTQGSVSTARHVFHARIGGVTVGADSPGGLTPLMDGAHLDEDVLALQLLLPVPWPLSQRSVWAGVQALDVGSWLNVRPDGEASSVRWWTPPDPTTPLAEATGAIRDALTQSVAARAMGQDLISADLSGGLDSTSLCFLADATGTPLLTHHWKPRDEGNKDTVWASRAADLLPSARHRSVDAEESPEWYEATHRQDEARDDAEGPLVWTRNRAQLVSLARTMAGEGSSRHLLGVGGDELFGVAPLFVWSLIRSNPVQGFRMARHFRSLNRWPLGATVRCIADSSSFARMLQGAASRIDAPPAPRFTPPLDWGRGDPRMPSWATGDAVATVRRLLRQAAGELPDPLHRDRLQHQTLEVAVLSGRAARQLNRALRPLGVEFESPFLDDRVIEAALSVRVADRVARGRYKPGLTAALRGSVPDSVLRRDDKGSFSREAYEGLYRNRQRLAGLCDDLRLADRGLVDAEALRTAFYQPMPETRQLGPFEATLACESWLRSDSAVAPHAVSPAEGTR